MFGAFRKIFKERISRSDDVPRKWKQQDARALTLIFLGERVHEISPF